MEFDLEAALVEAEQQMDAAEEALLATGLPPEQWALIREYILAANTASRVATLQALHLGFSEVTQQKNSPQP